MSYARFSTDDRAGRIRAMSARDNSQRPSGNLRRAGVVEIKQIAVAAPLICERGFEHHVAANFSTVASAVHEATTRYLGWDM